MNLIIKPEEVIKHPNVSNAYIYGGHGAHAKDLIERKLLVPWEDDHHAHFVFLPISIIGTAVHEIINWWVSQQQIVSFSGMMTKTRSGIPAMHFLFGPRATWQLKVVVANTFAGYSPLVQKLVERAQREWIKIIETGRVDHDEKMWVIQGFMHLWLVLAWKHQTDTIQTSLIKSWITPIQTIVEMIHENPHAEEVIKEFFDILPRHSYNLITALQEVVEKHLSEGDIENFWTPNSNRILNYARLTDDTIIASWDEIQAVRVALNTSGGAFLKHQIEKIRK